MGKHFRHFSFSCYAVKTNNRFYRFLNDRYKAACHLDFCRLICRNRVYGFQNLEPEAKSAGLDFHFKPQIVLKFLGDLRFVVTRDTFSFSITKKTGLQSIRYF